MFHKGTFFKYICSITEMSNSNIVYSTDREVMELQQDQNLKNVKHSDQKVRLHLDRKGGGKIVTVVKGLTHDDETMNELAKELKKKCGTGGSYKNNEILIQGNKRDIIQKIFIDKGYDAKLSGG